jgi:hypothetical protein
MSSQSKARLTGRQPPPIPPSQRQRGRPLVPLIPVTDDGCGPAMLALTPAMRAFVVAKIENGCSNAEAARAAGYSDASRHSLEVQAHRLAHDDRIQSALLEESQKLIRSHGARAVHVLVAIMDNKNAENKDRAKAATELLNRAGLNAVSQHSVSVEHSVKLTDSQREAEIIALCREMGLGETEARKMLIDPTKVIEGDFTEVQPEPVSPEVAAKRARKNELQRARERMTPEALAQHKAKVRAQRSAMGKAKRAAHAVLSESDRRELFGQNPSTMETKDEDHDC